ncbi:hypothetical protein Tco_1262766 [Tanacetum coccineum]
MTSSALSSRSWHIGDSHLISQNVNVDYFAINHGDANCYRPSTKSSKPKVLRRKSYPDTFTKQKPIQATKGDGVDTRSKVPDEQQQKTSGTDEGTGTIPAVPDVPIYESKKIEEDSHVTITLVHDLWKADEPVQISSVSSNFTSKLLNLENPSLADNEIASLMETSARHATTVPENTSGFTTTIPPPLPLFNPLQQEAIPTPTPTTSKTTTSLPAF